MALLDRTARFAKFLREAIDIRSERALDTSKYERVLWFSEMPVGVPQLRSPVLEETWPPDDFQWLTVGRVTEPAAPKPPGLCEAWLKDVRWDDTEVEPALVAFHRELEDGSVEEVPPGANTLQAWTDYLELKWRPWSHNARGLRRVKRVYEQLFSIHQQMLGEQDAFELFIGIGLLSMERLDDRRPVARHLLALPGGVHMDPRTGTLSLEPAPSFSAAMLEADFLDTQSRARIQKQWQDEKAIVEQVGPSLQSRDDLSKVLKALTLSLASDSTYQDGLLRTKAGPTPRTTFAPAIVFRRRGAMALEKLLADIESNVSGQTPRTSESEIPRIWRHLLEADDDGGGNDYEHESRPTAPERLYFPLPSNEEQSKIVRAASRPGGVVVQGPPGTGKSHTIANLISHYLAKGQRVLVTAQTAQALKVLRDKLPSELKQLCVTLLGSGPEADKELERNVRTILGRHQEAQSSPGIFAEQAAALERRHDELEAALTRHERLLADVRQEETVEFSPVAGYRGTKAVIARQLNDERPQRWIDDAVDEDAACPAFPTGLPALAAYHGSLGQDVQAELTLQWLALPFDPPEARDVVLAIGAAAASADTPQVDVPHTLPASALDRAVASLTGMRDLQSRVGPSDEGWLNAAQQSLFSRQLDLWRARLQESEQKVNCLTQDVVDAVVPVTVGGGRTVGEALRDLARLDDHFASGGTRRTLGVFTPAIVKETSWLSTEVRVGDVPVTTADDVTRARRALEGHTRLRTAWECWGDHAAEGLRPRDQVALLRARTAFLKEWLLLCISHEALPADVREWLDGLGRQGTAVATMLQASNARLSQMALADARARRDAVLARMPAAEPLQAASLQQIRDALVREDIAALDGGLRRHQQEHERRLAHRPYVEFLERVRTAAPRLASQLVASEGTTEYAERILQLEPSWNHRRAQSWLDRRLSADRVREAERGAASAREEIQDVQAKLVAAHAWHHGVSRIDRRKKTALAAWSDAVSRIPRTGKTVFARRAEARRLLSGCLDAIPAWVISLGRLYETIDATPGQFDVAIVDEASQCWLDSLVLLYIAKQVIVVGDDKQISPLQVGVKTSGLSTLANTLLHDLQFRGRYTLEASLFGLATIFFEHPIRLREHFRCMPEIIRFSSDLCYADQPLIPLRPPERDRLEPLKLTYIPDGLRREDLNDAEARAIVDAIAACDDDPRYEDATFGVVTLQGQMQAPHIEKLLLDRCGTQIFSRRRLRCGSPAEFQGDERDVMFLSMVAAPNVTNLALTASLYEQRFNVAMSRGRDQAWLFHSIQAHELSPSCLRRRLLTHFQNPPQLRHVGEIDAAQLQVVAHKALRSVERPPRPFDSWFEVDVALALSRKGYRISAQVEVASWRIDLVVEGDGWRLAVECDGDAWHGPDRWLEDLYRQRQLERAGWRFARVREALFYADPDAAVAPVLDGCDELASVPVYVVSPVVPTEALGSPDDDHTVVDRDREVDHGAMPTVEASPAEESVGDDVALAPAVHTGGARAPFDGYGNKEFPDPHTASSRDVNAAIMDIVETDGPVTLASIYRLYRDGCPDAKRAGKTLKQAVNRALYSLQRSGKLVTRDEGAARTPEERVVCTQEQQWVDVRPLGRRDFEEVPPSELAQRLRTASGGVAPTQPELPRLFREVLALYGLKSLTQATLQRFDVAYRIAYEPDYLASRNKRPGEGREQSLPL